MTTSTAEGVRMATSAEQRYCIQCLHNASEHNELALITLVSTKTPEEMYDVLAMPDIQVTNSKDKVAMLPVVKRMNEHVKEVFRATSEMNN